MTAATSEHRLFGDTDRSASEVLIDHALSVHWEALPADVRHLTATFLHDSLAVGTAGALAPFASEIVAVASRWAAGRGDCLVLGRPDVRLPADKAAFVNAFFIHDQEYDAVHEAAVVHPLATIVSVLLASAQAEGPVSGDDFLCALVAGVDVAVTLGLAATAPLKFFRPATAGIFGCVAALARLHRLDRSTAVNAFGLALAFASGTMQAHVEGLPVLPLQIAAAAERAIQAVDLARIGLPGPRAAIEGQFGYLALFEDGADLAGALAGLGKPHRIAEVSWKPFPTGRAAHGAIVAVQRLMTEHGVTADMIEQLEYRAPPLIRRLVGREARRGMMPAYARLCFPYLGASVLLRGGIGLDSFSPAMLADPAVLDLAERIAVIDDGSSDPAAFVPATATARLKDNRTVQVTITAQLGSPADPLTADEHLAKAAGCLAYAGIGERADGVAKACRTIVTSTDVGATLERLFEAYAPTHGGIQRTSI